MNIPAPAVTCLLLSFQSLYFHYAASISFSFVLQAACLGRLLPTRESKWVLSAMNPLSHPSPAFPDPCTTMCGGEDWGHYKPGDSMLLLARPLTGLEKEEFWCGSPLFSKCGHLVSLPFPVQREKQVPCQTNADV